MDNDAKQEHYALADRLYSEEKFTSAIVTGTAAALIAAAAFAVTVATWAFTYGFAVAGIGIAVGLSMRYSGRGVSTKFAVAAAACTMAGCLLGNLFLEVLQQAHSNSNSPFAVLQERSLLEIAQMSVSGVSLIDVIYWFVAAVCAVFLAKRPLTRSQRLAIGLADLRR